MSGRLPGEPCLIDNKIATWPLCCTEPSLIFRDASEEADSAGAESGLRSGPGDTSAKPLKGAVSGTLGAPKLPASEPLLHVVCELAGLQLWGVYCSPPVHRAELKAGDRGELASDAAPLPSATVTLPCLTPCP